MGQNVKRCCVSMVLTTFASFLIFLLLLHWIEKWSSCGRLLEHLESFGTKIIMRGPIVREL